MRLSQDITEASQIGFRILLKQPDKFKLNRHMLERFPPRNGVFDGQVVNKQIRVEPPQLAEAEVDEVEDGRLDRSHGRRHVDVQLDHLRAAEGQGLDNGQVKSRPQVKLEN